MGNYHYVVLLDSVHINLHHKRMRTMIPAIGIMFAGVLIVLGLGAVIDGSIAGAALPNANVGTFFSIVPTIMIAMFLPLVFMGLVAAVWFKFMK
jgi:hypothetical protein